MIRVSSGSIYGFRMFSFVEIGTEVRRDIHRELLTISKARSVLTSIMTHHLVGTKAPSEREFKVHCGTH